MMDNNFFGFKIITSNVMTVTEEKIVFRTWRERLFSFPWRPMQKTKTVYFQVPDQRVIIDHNRNIVFCHPSILGKIQEVVDDTR